MAEIDTKYAINRRIYCLISYKNNSRLHHFAIFPYVNGKLFEPHYRPPSFDSAMRSQLLTLCGLDWGSISPAIFGAMFQTVIEFAGLEQKI